LEKDLMVFNENTFDNSWKENLMSFSGLEKNWQNREQQWTYGQLLSMCFYDKSLDENFIHLGGYGIGNDAANPGEGFNMREVAETAIILSYFNPELAKSSIRWMAKTQLEGGDLPRKHHHFPLKRPDVSQRLDELYPQESDTEIWFMMACGEYYKATGDLSFFEEEIPFRTLNASGSIWEHVVAAKNFVVNDVGTGDDGLVRMLEGDWNDYFSLIGSEGNGQSMMNTGMICKALDVLIPVAVELDPTKKEEFEELLTSYRSAGQKLFDREWFVRAVDDHGNWVGGADDRLFVNAQSWAALGKVGTPDQRRKALLNTLKECHTDIGLMLMSRPYSSPAPKNISWAPISAGEGENAGIWPQTVAWIVWALAEEGLLTEAMDLWEINTLENHSNKYPEVPFGVINGPDCYSSKFAGDREGWTQVEMFNRMIEIPMNPIIAWQAFTMKKILLSK